MNPFAKVTRSRFWKVRLVFGSLMVVFCVIVASHVFANVQGVTPTNQWMDLYSTNSTFQGRPLQPGDYVAVFDPQGVQCGEFTVTTTGYYGIMPCYGDDPNTVQDEGAVSGDRLHFTINGYAATSSPAVVIWNSGERWEVDLSVAAPTPTPTPSPTPTSTPTPTATPTPAATPSEVWRFRGYVYEGEPNDANPPLSGVELRLYGRAEGTPAPGTFIKAAESDDSGFFNFYIVDPYIYDIMNLRVYPPDGMAAIEAQSDDGNVLSPSEIEWQYPEPGIHQSQFYLQFATPTPTPTSSPTVTPTATPSPTPVIMFLPIFLHG